MYLRMFVWWIRTLKFNVVAYFKMRLVEKLGKMQITYQINLLQRRNPNLVILHILDYHSDECVLGCTA